MAPVPTPASARPPPRVPQPVLGHESAGAAREGRDGFTLVELLVALFITAIMFAIGYRALDQALTSRQELDEHTARLIAVRAGGADARAGFRAAAAATGAQSHRRRLSAGGHERPEQHRSGREPQQPQPQRQRTAAHHLHARRLDQSGGYSAQRAAARELQPRERRADPLLLRRCSMPRVPMCRSRAR